MNFYHKYLVRYNNKCVCEVCNCNTHKCPTQYPPQNKIVPISHQDYKFPNNFTKASPFKPQSDYNPTKADPNHFKTHNQLSYQPNYFEASPPQERVKKGYDFNKNFFHIFQFFKKVGFIRAPQTSIQKYPGYTRQNIVKVLQRKRTITFTILQGQKKSYKNPCLLMGKLRTGKTISVEVL